MKVFTTENLTVTTGAQIENVVLKGAGVTIPGIVVGSEGRGRERAVVPVENAVRVPCRYRPSVQNAIQERNRKRRETDPAINRQDYEPVSTPWCSVCGDCGAKVEYVNGEWHHPESGTVYAPLTDASLGVTRTGKAKLFAGKDDDDRAIVVMRSGIGYRGNNGHFDDDFDADDHAVALSCFILAKGVIAQGDAGRMGSGEQLVILVEPGYTWGLHRSGRLYGAPEWIWYHYDGQKIQALSDEDRKVSDLF